MRLLFALNGAGALRLAPAKGEILAGSFVERDHQVVRRHARAAATRVLTSFRSASRDLPSRWMAFGQLSIIISWSTVIAHPPSARGCRGRLAANTNWRTASTDARLAFAVRTTERNAAAVSAPHSPRTPLGTLRKIAL